MSNVAYVKYTISDILDSFKQPLPFEQPLYETIANSLEADATNIIIEFFIDDSQHKIEAEDIKVVNRINGFEITDNGVGFTPENIDSFTKFKSKLKRKIGCKGVGRFTWLKVFEDIKIKSQTKNTYIEFDFNKNFDFENIKPINQISDETWTTINFSNVTTLYKKYAKKKREKDIDERTIANLENIKELIIQQLLVKLFLLHEKEKKQFKITLKLGSDETIISNENIKKLNEKEFKILDTLDQSVTPKYYNFNLYYNFEDNADSKPIQSYCAAGRLVAPFTDTVKIKNLPEKDKILNMLLTSEYFDERTTEERNDFSFSKNDVNKTTVNPIPLNEINENLSKLINEILADEFPNLNTHNENIKSECIDEYPYLGKYIRQDDSAIVDKSILIDNAEKQYQKEKKEAKNNFIKMLESKKYTDKDTFIKNLTKVNDISARELAEYFLYREQIICGLEKLIESNSSIENDLHEIFLPKNIISTANENELSKYDTNVWLLDDKFMSYLKAFSDIEIKTISEQIENNMVKVYGEKKKPDLALFYNDIDDNCRDVVLVEFKALNVSADRKVAAYAEINRNFQFVIKGIQNIRTLYGYIITELDEDFCQYLEAQPGITPLFTTGENPIYYYFNDNLKDNDNNKKACHVYILSTKAICHDAKSRNKTFLDIIKNK